MYIVGFKTHICTIYNNSTKIGEERIDVYKNNISISHCN